MRDPKVRLTTEQMDKEVADFNLKIPEGAEVEYRKDDGTWVETTTRSVAWVLSGHTPVVMVIGIGGCVALDRVRQKNAAVAALVADALDHISFCEGFLSEAVQDFPMFAEAYSRLKQGQTILKKIGAAHGERNPKAG